MPPAAEETAVVPMAQEETDPASQQVGAIPATPKPPAPPVKVKHRSQLVLFPTSKWMRKWNGIMALLMLFTSIVTPYEVAFLETICPQNKIDILFLINRLVDLVFVTDIIINMHLSYYDNHRAMWVGKLPLIRRHYVCGWFTIDFLSTIPYDCLGCFMDADSLSSFKVLRVLKLLKLLRLLRILKSMRIFKRLQAQLGLSNSASALIKFLVAVLLTLHWVACFWRLVPAMQDENESWISSKMARNNVTAIPTAELYVATVEFSFMIMVLSYGDTSPINTGERCFAILCMAFAGSVYAYSIGSICSVISLRDPASIKFQETMDLLTKYLTENNMPTSLRVRMREYLNHCKALIRNEYYQSQILPSMPRSLQAEAALCAHAGNKSVGAHCVPFMCCKDDAERASFIMSATLKLQHLVCPPTETLYTTGETADKMYIVASGLCRKATFMKRKGEYFGQEMLMKDAVRIDSASAVTYLHLMLLLKSDLAEILADNKQLYKQTRKLIRVTTIKLTIFRVVREIGRAALTVRRADTKRHQTFRRMKENEIEAYKM
jgi:potassium voltage-gated channel Eag-related subfamily H protein 7